MLRLLICLLLYAAVASAQDRFFYSNGIIGTGRLIRINGDSVLYRSPENADVQVIEKVNLRMIETADGKRYLFAKPRINQASNETSAMERHVVGLQPADVLVGRATIVYEQLSANGKIGLAFPLSLTFDPTQTLYGLSDSAAANNPAANRIGFIAGADLNFYTDKPLHGFFLGPRFRFGTDVYLGGLEGYTLQTQIGLRNKSRIGLLQHISIGFGLVRVLEGPLPYGFNNKFIPWYSINYRVSLAW